MGVGVGVGVGGAPYISVRGINLLPRIKAAVLSL